MKIVLALVKQVGGELHILPGDNGRGTRFAVTFGSRLSPARAAPGMRSTAASSSMRRRF